MDNECKELSTQQPSGDAVMITAVNVAIREVIMPFMASLSEMMRNNTEALQYLAAQQKVQTDHMEALEKQIRLNTLVTPTQSRYLNDAIRKRAKEILNKKGCIDDKKAVTKLSAAIRKAVLSRYGIASLNEIPKHEYSVAMQQIDTWNDAMTVMSITRESKKRTEQEKNMWGGDDEKDCSGLVEDDYHV